MADDKKKATEKRRDAGNSKHIAVENSNKTGNSITEMKRERQREREGKIERVKLQTYKRTQPIAVGIVANKKKSPTHGIHLGISHLSIINDQCALSN